MSKLVIVESPTKAKTISKFLGHGFVVESSFGHIRDLPKTKMGIEIENGSFEPKYIIPTDKKKQVTKLKKLSEKSDEIIFATDQDREGEAISWHLAKVLDLAPTKAKRIVFHEITKQAIEQALENPKKIDQKLVDAQQARRVLDRLVGYELSPFLWKKVATGLSAGRVQSVAVRLIVEREREIQAFGPQEYWTITGLFHDQPEFQAILHSIDEKKLGKLDLKTKEQTDIILADLNNAVYKIERIEKKEAKRLPPPPFTTSTLQQAANQKLGYSAKQTMVLAQQLYEGVALGEKEHVGLITYMRTDSLSLSAKFLESAKGYIKEKIGKEYSLTSPRVYKTKSKGAQEAHEAIRPTDPYKTPEMVESFLTPQQHKLYSLIWKRAMATQMAAANLDKTNMDICAKKYLFRATGQIMIFPGWLRLYPDSVKEEMLPELKEGQAIKCNSIKPEQHFTEPPARYSDATLVKAMEEYGIGRPSTYSPTIATIEDRGYVERDDNKKLKPKDIAMVVNDLLVKHFNNIVDYQFTAQMENDLDNIAEGKKKWQPVIADFYYPFHENLEKKTKELSREETMQARELGTDPESGKPIYAKIGRFGPYVQKGSKEDEEKPVFASLLKGQSVGTVTLEQALILFSLPKILGTDEKGNQIIANIGRYGPYIKVKDKFFSIKGMDPFAITLTQAIEVINNQDHTKAKQIIKEFTQENIKIVKGRYGPYITDGNKNARVPKDKEPSSLELEECISLLSTAKEKRFRKRKK